MTLICTISVLAGIFVSPADVEGKLLATTRTQYYVDFSEDLKKNEWQLWEGRNGRKLVEKSSCVTKPGVKK